MCNVKVKDRVPIKELRERLEIDDIILIRDVVSVLTSRSRDVVSKRLGLVSVSWKPGKVSVSISSPTENQMSQSRLGLVP